MVLAGEGNKALSQADEPDGQRTVAEDLAHLVIGAQSLESSQTPGP